MDTAKGAAREPPCDENYPWLGEALRQLSVDVDALLPDWMIEGMLTDFDRRVIEHINKESVPAGHVESQQAQQEGGGGPQSVGDPKQQRQQYDPQYRHDQQQEYEAWKAHAEHLQRRLQESVESNGGAGGGAANSDQAAMMIDALETLPGSELFDKSRGDFQGSAASASMQHR
eukprot:GHVU01181324.1.p1 GENE.GHVU01181324.1~~GHVU01181324.1.p1  ORF type:complete len:192 (-),score=56.76 GHVU01181324.1:536-1054(-)